MKNMFFDTLWCGFCLFQLHDSDNFRIFASFFGEVSSVVRDLAIIIVSTELAGGSFCVFL